MATPIVYSRWGVQILPAAVLRSNMLDIDVDRLRKIFEAPNTISSCLGLKDKGLKEISHSYKVNELGNVSAFTLFEDDRFED